MSGRGVVWGRRLILVLFAVWCLFPLYWMIGTALKREVDALAYPPSFVFRPTLQNYRAVIGDPKITEFFKNSSIVGLGSTAIGLLVGVPTAYVLGRHEFRGRRDYDFWVLSTRMAPPVAMLVPFFILFRQLHLTDSLRGLMIAHVSQNLAIIIWVMKGFFSDLPAELEEAALVDGGSYWRAFRQIILPLTVPGIAATGVLAFLFSWNEFLFATVLSGTHTRTAPVGLYTFVGFQSIDWGQLSASASIMLVPVFVLLVAFQRQLIRGLTFGAVRG